MATLGSKLVTKEMDWHSNMTEQNHLGAALIARPHKFEGVMNKLFSAENYYSDNPLTGGLLTNSMTEEEIGSTSWEWELKGANTRPLVIIENVIPTSNATPGRMRRNFKIKLDQNWFVAGDVLHPGTSNKKYQVRIVADPVRHGKGWLYEVRLNSDDSQSFLPPKFLRPGQQWAKLFSQYEEAAEQSGSTQYSMPLALSNKMSKYRKKYEVTDYASTEVLAVAMQDKKGKSHSSWIRYAEVEFWQEWYKELERGAWYSRSADTVVGANGRPVRMGPGIQEQLEDSHVHRYTHLTTRLIEDYLMDIFYNRTKLGYKSRTIRGYTGEYGMIQFHRAIQSEVERGGFVKNFEQFSSGQKTELHENSIGYGFQFTRYSMANGITLELIHNPLYDDRNINFELDPISGLPVESQRITFLDFAGSGGEKTSNIKMMNKKDGYAFAYINGLYGPMGPSKGGQAAHSGAYYEMHCEKSCGVHIEDITKCGELIFDVDSL